MTRSQSAKFSASRELSFHLLDSTSPKETSYPVFDISDTVSLLTNSFVGHIDLTNKVGDTLYTKATACIYDDDKFDFSLKKSQYTVKAIEHANQQFYWGSLCFKIPLTKTLTDVDLIQNYNNISQENGISHSRSIGNLEQQI